MDVYDIRALNVNVVGGYCFTRVACMFKEDSFLKERHDAYKASININLGEIPIFFRNALELRPKLYKKMLVYVHYVSCYLNPLQKGVHVLYECERLCV